MTRDNPLQFAVVREDPNVESQLLAEASGADPRVVLIASGGCTALTLQARHPDASIVLVDPNPAQLAHIRRKIAALELPVDERRRAFNVGHEDPQGLSESGNFESLFRGLRELLWEFVATPDEWRSLLDPATAQPPGLLDRILGDRYWPVVFELFLHDEFLHAMFSQAATQHAEPGSYPAYFRRAFERGLRSPDASMNYFLHHVFLGCYLPSATPQFIDAPAANDQFEWVEGVIDEAEEHFADSDLVHLSNIFDWYDESDVIATARLLGAKMRPGGVVLWRQLNNTRDFRGHFGDGFSFDTGLGASLLGRERSLFYSSIVVGKKL